MRAYEIALSERFGPSRSQRDLEIAILSVRNRDLRIAIRSAISKSRAAARSRNRNLKLVIRSAIWKPRSHRDLENRDLALPWGKIALNIEIVHQDTHRTGGRETTPTARYLYAYLFLQVHVGARR